MSFHMGHIEGGTRDNSWEKRVVHCESIHGDLHVREAITSGTFSEQLLHLRCYLSEAGAA